MIKAGLTATLVALAAMIVISAYGFITIPEDAVIARHWGLHGQPDGWSPRNHALIGMPLAAVVLALVFAAIPAIDPRTENVRRSRGLYLSAWIGAVVLLTLVHASIVLSATRGGEMDPAIVLYAVSALFAVMGNFLAKSRSSWFLGVRTPWSLSSEHAWIAANRTTGWLFVLTGAGAAAAGLLRRAEDGFAVLVAGALAAALAGVVVSYIAWRRDPERRGSRADSV